MGATLAGILAHAGGWDEILIAAGAVLLVATPRLIGAARRRAAEKEPRCGPCLYCGRFLDPKVVRCPECGFRARRGPAGDPKVPSASPSGGGR